MSTLNSKTTGHNQVQEQKFSKKLFLILIALILTAAIIFVIIGQRNDLSIQPSHGDAVDSKSVPFTSPDKMISPSDSTQTPQKK